MTKNHNLATRTYANRIFFFVPLDSVHKPMAMPYTFLWNVLNETVCNYNEITCVLHVHMQCMLKLTLFLDKLLLILFVLVKFTSQSSRCDDYKNWEWNRKSPFSRKTIKSLQFRKNMFKWICSAFLLMLSFRIINSLVLTWKKLNLLLHIHRMQKNPFSLNISFLFSILECKNLSSPHSKLCSSAKKTYSSQLRGYYLSCLTISFIHLSHLVWNTYIGMTTINRLKWNRCETWEPLLCITMPSCLHKSTQFSIEWWTKCELNYPFRLRSRHHFEPQQSEQDFELMVSLRIHGKSRQLWKDRLPSSNVE